MIIVTGASGQLGQGVVNALLARVPAGAITVSVRDPAKAADLAGRGVQVQRGDFADPASLTSAFAGAEQVLLISADKLGEEALRLHHAAISAASNSGVRRILYTSHMGARHGSPFAPADQHARTEDDLAASGVPFTALRHGFYAESCLQMIGEGLKAGELRVPEDGPVSWTARGDLAEADAVILAGNGAVDGITPPLTAADAVTMADIAAIASKVGGRNVRHVTVADDEWRDARVSAGMPPFYADMLLGTFRAARRGDFAAVDPTLGQLLGRPPRSLRDVLAAFLSRGEHAFRRQPPRRTTMPKTVLITGANRSIGYETARRLGELATASGSAHVTKGVAKPLPRRYATSGTMSARSTSPWTSASAGACAPAGRG